jgi:hypothetical protein
MRTVEPERCSSKLNRIESFLRSAMAERWLNPLGVLTVEMELIRSLPGFSTTNCRQIRRTKEQANALLIQMM